jgi:zinc/manganese transport system ATP-binding protein
MSAAAITCDDLTVAYERHPAVHHLSGRFPVGSLTAVVGPNGAGKSTLLKAIVGFIEPDEGRIVRHLADPRRDIAYLPQLAEIDREFPMTVRDFVSAGAWRRCGAFRGIGSEIRDGIAAALASVGMQGFEKRLIGRLSGGQFQRILFARLVLQDAPVILLDEPFAAIDARTVDDLMRLIAGWHDGGKTVIAVLHEFDLVRAQFPEALLLAREPIAWGATASVLSPTNLDAMRRKSLIPEDDAPICSRGDAA